MTLEICVVAKAWSVGQDLGGFLLDEINHFHNNKKPVFSTKKVYSIIIILIRPVSTRLVSVWGLKNSVDFDMRYDYNFKNRLILTRLTLLGLELTTTEIHSLGVHHLSASSAGKLGKL